MTKSVDNGEILTFENESMSDQPLPKDRYALVQSKIRWLNFEKSIICLEKYLQYKSYLAKAHDNDESILSPICINNRNKW